MVGGGPVGLMVACELALRGVSATVLERRDAIDPTVKAAYVNVPAAEALFRRGLLPEQPKPPTQARPGAAGKSAGPRFAGHFGGLLVDASEIDESDPGWRDTGFDVGIQFLPQQVIEERLEARARESGVDVRRGVEVIDTVDRGEDVIVTCADGSEVTARWLVACDGGRSAIRKRAEVPFDGDGPTMTGRQALVRWTGADALPVGWRRTPTGVFRRLGDLVLAAEFDGAPENRDEAITSDELESSIERVAGIRPNVNEIRSATRFTDNTRVARSYRSGRILLAGDAAHVHPPFGGQGLGLGIVDATNLAWRLALVVHGHPEGLLDGYTEERRPAAEWVLQFTRAQVGVMRTDSRSRAAGEMIARLMSTRDGATILAQEVSGVRHRYELGEPPIGDTAPNVRLADGARLSDRLAAGTGALVRPEDTVDPLPFPYTLIRPDGVIAWGGDEAPEPAAWPVDVPPAAFGVTS